MEENFLLAKETVLKKYSKEDPYYAFFVCSLYGLFQKYGEYKDLIIKFFLETIIYIENGTVKEICDRHRIKNDYPKYDRSLGRMICDDDVKKTDEKITIIPGKRYIICRKHFLTEKILINIFCHELAHLIKGYYRKHEIQELDEDTVLWKERKGICIKEREYNIKTKSERIKSIKYHLLDEAINSIQITEVMEEIFGLREFVDDPIIIEFLDSLNKEVLANDQGYYGATHALRKLWEVYSFKRLMEEYTIKGDIETLNQLIDERVEKGFLESLNGTLEHIRVQYDEWPSYIDEFIRNSKIDEYIKKWEEGFKDYAYTYSSTNQD